MSGDEMIAFATEVYNTHFKECWVSREDLIAEGCEAILRYESKWDESKGCCLSTYLWKCVKGRMLAFYKRERKYGSNCVEYNDDEVDGVQDDYACLVYEESLRKLRDLNVENKRQAEIIGRMLNGDRQVDVVRETGESRQYVNKIWMKYCRKMRGKLELVDGEIIEKGRC